MPAGAHTVNFGYEPPYILWSVVGLLLGCGWLLVGRRLI
jgi:hypothetical protein